MKTRNLIAAFLALALLAMPCASAAQSSVHDKEKEMQWRSMENGPWGFSPGWYYYFMHKKYSGAKKKWRWHGFKSGYVVRFKEERSNIRRVMPVRVTAEETQRQKLSQAEKELASIEVLYKEEVAREADRAVDLAYPSYKDEFNRMQGCITDGLLYCLSKSGGKLQCQVEELSRQNELLCADIAYIHKSGAGYGLENAKRRQAYEEAKAKMGELVGRIARLCAVAATIY